MTDPKESSDEGDIYAGMSVNERLFVAGVLKDFEEAERRRDRNRMVELLTRVRVPRPEETADRILRS